jgi:hypothetical protein
MKVNPLIFPPGLVSIPIAPCAAALQLSMLAKVPTCRGLGISVLVKLKNKTNQ